MKTIRHGEITCTFAVDPEFRFTSEVPCSYEQDTIRYAVERFLPRSKDLCRECALDSWHIRLASGRGRRPRHFSWLVSSAELELPGVWTRLSGTIDAGGGTLHRVELLQDHPKNQPRKDRKDRQSHGRRDGYRR